MTNSRNGEVKMDGCTKLKQSVLVNLAPYHESMTAHSRFLRNLFRVLVVKKDVCALDGDDVGSNSGSNLNQLHGLEQVTSFL